MNHMSCTNLNCIAWYWPCISTSWLILYPVFPVHPCLSPCIWQQHHCEICRWHDCGGTDHPQQWISLQSRDRTWWTGAPGNNLSLNDVKPKSMSSTSEDHRSRTSLKSSTVRFLAAPQQPHMDNTHHWTGEKGTAVTDFLRTLKKAKLPQDVLVSFFLYLRV